MGEFTEFPLAQGENLSLKAWNELAKANGYRLSMYSGYLGNSTIMSIYNSSSDADLATVENHRRGTKHEGVGEIVDEDELQNIGAFTGLDLNGAYLYVTSSTTGNTGAFYILSNTNDKAYIYSSSDGIEFGPIGAISNYYFYEVGPAKMMLKVVGGANESEKEFDLTDENYDDVSELVAAINSYGKGWVAKIQSKQGYYSYPTEVFGGGRIIHVLGESKEVLIGANSATSYFSMYAGWFGGVVDRQHYIKQTPQFATLVEGIHLQHARQMVQQFCHYYQPYSPFSFIEYRKDTLGVLGDSATTSSSAYSLTDTGKFAGLNLLGAEVRIAESDGGNTGTFYILYHTDNTLYFANDPGDGTDVVYDLIPRYWEKGGVTGIYGTAAITSSTGYKLTDVEKFVGRDIKGFKCVILSSTGGNTGTFVISSHTDDELTLQTNPGNGTDVRYIIRDDTYGPTILLRQAFERDKWGYAKVNLASAWNEVYSCFLHLDCHKMSFSDSQLTPLYSRTDFENTWAAAKTSGFSSIVEITGGAEFIGRRFRGSYVPISDGEGGSIDRYSCRSVVGENFTRYIDYGALKLLAIWDEIPVTVKVTDAWIKMVLAAPDVSVDNHFLDSEFMWYVNDSPAMSGNSVIRSDVVEDEVYWFHLNLLETLTLNTEDYQRFKLQWEGDMNSVPDADEYPAPIYGVSSHFRQYIDINYLQLYVKVQFDPI